MEHFLIYFIVLGFCLLNVFFFHFYQIGISEYKKKIPLQTVPAILKRIIAQTFFLIWGTLFIIPFFSPEILLHIGINLKLNIDSIYSAILVTYIPVFGAYFIINRKSINGLNKYFNITNKRT